MIETLKKGLSELGLPTSEKVLDSFARYAQMLIEWNQKFNLTSITSPQEVAVKHFLDSVLASPLIEQDANICDVGSGAGFPSLPLLIVRPDLKATLIESTQKKASFLKAVAEELGLHAQIAAIRCEDAGRSMRESFDVVVARAVAETCVLCEYLLPLAKVGGKIIAYKSEGQKEEIAAAANAARMVGGTPFTLKQYNLPQSENTVRILAESKKIKPTPQEFPRSGNKARLKKLQ